MLVIDKGPLLADSLGQGLYSQQEPQGPHMTGKVGPRAGNMGPGGALASLGGTHPFHLDTRQVQSRAKHPCSSGGV